MAGSATLPSSKPEAAAGQISAPHIAIFPQHVSDTSFSLVMKRISQFGQDWKVTTAGDNPMDMFEIESHETGHGLWPWM